MYPQNVKSFAIAIVAALGFLLATVPVASAQNVFQCTGTIADGRTINTSLTVPANATCELDNVTVAGNVGVGTGAVLNVLPAPRQAVKIDGNLTADQCNYVALSTEGGVILIGGNVTIQNCTGAVVGYSGPGITIGGNFVCVGNPLTCVADDGVVNGNLTVEENLFSSSTIITNSEVLQNTISGNAEIGGNTGPAPLTVGGNTIGGNLQCVGNSQTPDDGGTPNTVSGQKLGQCAGL
jgi:hypothetical protein